MPGKAPPSTTSIDGSLPATMVTPLTSMPNASSGRVMANVPLPLPMKAEAPSLAEASPSVASSVADSWSGGSSTWPGPRDGRPLMTSSVCEYCCTSVPSSVTEVGGASSRQPRMNGPRSSPAPPIGCMPNWPYPTSASMTWRRAVISRWRSVALSKPPNP